MISADQSPIGGNVNYDKKKHALISKDLQAECQCCVYKHFYHIERSERRNINDMPLGSANDQAWSVS